MFSFIFEIQTERGYYNVQREILRDNVHYTKLFYHNKINHSYCLRLFINNDATFIRNINFIYCHVFEQSNFYCV